MPTLTDNTDRQLPWDAMGSALSSDATTVAQALKETGLDYQVETRRASAGAWLPPTDSPAGNALITKRPTVTAPDFQAIVRPMPDGSEKVLAFTKKRYTPIQNVAAFSIADHLVAEWGATIAGAADYRNGDRSILTVKLPNTVRLTTPGGDADDVDLYLMVVNDHAGNAALSLALTTIRVPCTNAVPAALRKAQRVWKIAHTPNGQKRLDVAAEAIRQSLVYAESFQATAQAMMDQPMVDAEFAKLVQQLYPVDRDAEGVAAERRRDLHADLTALWRESPTLEGVRGTRWAGLNVFTEYLDHYRPVRGDVAVARGEGALEGKYARDKAALWDRFAALA